MSTEPEYTIAEAEQLDNGNTRYVIEYHREGNGVQRPTFEYPAGLSLDAVMEDMKNQLDEERRINESERPKLKKLKGITGKKF